jgi:hypothetical protein
VALNASNIRQLLGNPEKYDLSRLELKDIKDKKNIVNKKTEPLKAIPPLLKLVQLFPITFVAAIYLLTYV